MTNKEIQKGDFVLITDPRESSRYLKIGEVTNIETQNNGDDWAIGLKEYTVRFGSNYDTGKEDLDWYDSDFPKQCKILKFDE